MNQSFYVFDLQSKKAFPVRSGFIFGRGDDSDIQILDKIISRKHACIEQRADQFFIKDFGNPIGTLLNQKMIQGESPLQLGDRIQIGEAQFEIRLSEEKLRAPQKKVLESEAPKTETRLTAVFLGFQSIKNHLALAQQEDAIEKWNVQLGAFIENHQGILAHHHEGKIIVTWEKTGVRDRFMALSLARTLVLGATVFWESDEAIHQLKKRETTILTAKNFKPLIFTHPR